MYTVEYEELRAGLDGKGGVGMFWFPVVETFRVGQIDDPQSRAVDRVTRLCCTSLHRVRRVSIVAWPVGNFYDVTVESKGRHVARI